MTHPEINPDADILDRLESEPLSIHLAGAAAEEIRRLRAAMEWQPIETAPRDGSSVLCYHPFNDADGRICILRWDLSPSAQVPAWRTDVHSFVKFEPTRWMPLPQLPKDTP